MKLPDPLLPVKPLRMNEIQRLAKYLHYILVRQPDACGIVPDGEGFYPLKDVLHALRESSWPRVRLHDIMAMNYHLSKPEIETTTDMIRAIDRRHQPSIAPTTTPPKLLFACVRRKAYYRVQRNGLDTPPPHIARIVLFAESDLALTVGRRKDRAPILVTVHTTLAQRLSLTFERFGDHILLAPAIPAECCTLPPPPVLPKSPKPSPAPATERQAGSYQLDWQNLASAASKWPPAGKTKKRKAERGRTKHRRP